MFARVFGGVSSHDGVLLGEKENGLELLQVGDFLP